MRNMRVSALGLVWIFVSSASMADTITVDPNGGGDHTAIQPAIDAAQDGDTVLVKPGEYVITEPITFLGKAITVKGENGPRETTVRMSEAPADRKRASVVVFENGEDDRARLDGFTITGGSGITLRPPWDPLGFGRRGGGVFCRGSSPTLTNCTITGNDVGVWGWGGGVYTEQGSEPTLENCTITENSAYVGGGVVSSEPSGSDATPALINCIVWDNTGGSIALVDDVIYSCIEHRRLPPDLGTVNPEAVVGRLFHKNKEQR